MKTKGVPVWELYLEWIVLALAVILFVYFVGSQFVGSPNSVTLDNKQLAPGEVDEYLDGIARSINRQLSDSAPPGVEIQDPESSLPEIQAKLDSNVSPRGDWSVPLIAALDPHDSTDNSEAMSVGLPYLVPEPPAPSQVTTEQFFNTVTPTVREEYASLAEHLPAEQPFDVTWVTAKAEIDFSDLLLLYRDGIADKARPFRSNWFDGRVDILDVIVEREELIDGAWTDPVILDPLESQVSLRPKLDGPKTTGQRDELLSQARDEQQQESMLRPEFYPLRERTSWTLNSEDAGAAVNDNESQLERTVREYKSLLAEKMKLELEWDDRNCQTVDLNTTSTGTTSAGGSSDSGGPTMTGVGSGRGSDDSADDADKEERRICRRIKTQLDAAGIKIKRLERRLVNLGVDLESLQVPVDPSDVEMNTAVEVWVHDISTVPGHIYRYRMRAVVYNPLFGRKLSLQSDQFELAEKLVIPTPWSDYSAPIDVQPPLIFFVTAAESAEQQGQSGLGLSLGQARVEVHRFYDGRWWSQPFAVEPGDLIGHTRQVGDKDRDVDFATNWFVLDVITNLDAANEPSNVRARLAAHVLLQREDRIEQFEIRDPERDSGDWVRAELLAFEDAPQQEPAIDETEQPGGGGDAPSRGGGGAPSRGGGGAPSRGGGSNTPGMTSG